MDWRVRSTIGVVALLVCSTGLSVVSASDLDGVPVDLNTGPYVDKIVYNVIENQDERFLAINAGEAEMDTAFFNPSGFNWLGEDPDLDIFSALRNGYGHITINTRKYPLNISAFRRAFAFAFDKTRVTAEIMDGFSQEHDSLVPYVSGWCIEDDFEFHYYTNEADRGNQILDAAGFTIDPDSGHRLAPDGSPFEVVIDYAASSPEIAGGVAQIAVDALRDLHVDASLQGSTFSDYTHNTLFYNYDMMFYGAMFYGSGIEWLAYDYWSEYADEPYQNPTNFRNETLDSWRDQLLYGTTYEEVYEAGAEMQKILHYNVPRLVVYMNTYMQCYRNDKFENHVGDTFRFITGPWTMRKITRIDSNQGGVVPIVTPEGVSTFNLFMGENSLHRDIMDNLYSSLYRYDPKQRPVEDLASNCTIETHSDNPQVPEGHQRFTIDIIQNATWTDGAYLTAKDVAMTFSYILESGVYGNPLATHLGDLQSAYALGPYRVVLEFSSESYWHFEQVAFTKILPAHVFNEDGGVGYDEWNTWNPGFKLDHPFVTCGPFILTEFESGAMYNLTQNPDYHYLPAVSSQEITTTTSTTTTTVIPSDDEDVLQKTGNPWMVATTTAISFASIEIIIVVTVLAYRDHRRHKLETRFIEEEKNRNWIAEIFG